MTARLLAAQGVPNVSPSSLLPDDLQPPLMSIKPSEM